MSIVRQGGTCHKNNLELCTDEEVWRISHCNHVQCPVATLQIDCSRSRPDAVICHFKLYRGTR